MTIFLIGNFAALLIWQQLRQPFLDVSKPPQTRKSVAEALPVNWPQSYARHSQTNLGQFSIGRPEACIPHSNLSSQPLEPLHASEPEVYRVTGMKLSQETPADSLRQLKESELVLHLANTEKHATTNRIEPILDELKRRGWTRSQLKSVLDLLTADVPRRKTLMQSLFRQEEIDPLPWLLCLSNDPQPEIRQQAIEMVVALAGPEQARRYLSSVLPASEVEQVNGLVALLR